VRRKRIQSRGGFWKNILTEKAKIEGKNGSKPELYKEIISTTKKRKTTRTINFIQVGRKLHRGKKLKRNPDARVRKPTAGTKGR